MSTIKAMLRGQRAAHRYVVADRERLTGRPRIYDPTATYYLDKAVSDDLRTRREAAANWEALLKAQK